MNKEIIVDAGKELVSKVGPIAAEYSPAIATGIGIGGILATAFLGFKAGKAWPEAKGRLEKVKEQPDKLDRLFDTAKVVVPVFGPVVLTGALTAATFVVGQRITWNRYKVLAAAHSMTSSSFEEYKTKVKEFFGEDKEEEMEQQLLEDAGRRYTKDYVIGTGSGDELFLDKKTGRWFRSNPGAIRQAEADIVYRLSAGDAQSVNDLYIRMGLPGIGIGHDFMWLPDSDNDRPNIVLHGMVNEEDDSLYYVVDYDFPKYIDESRMWV